MREYQVAYFTASCDDEETNTKFAKELELDYPILSDPTGKVAKAFGIYNELGKYSARKTFIIGKDGKILFVFDKVDVAKHGAEIVEQLSKLKVEKRKAE